MTLNVPPLLTNSMFVGSQEPTTEPLAPARGQQILPGWWLVYPAAERPPASHRRRRRLSRAPRGQWEVFSEFLQLVIPRGTRLVQFLRTPVNQSTLKVRLR